MQEGASTYLALAVNWRHWLDSLYQYGRVPSVIVFIGGITFTLIYLVKLLRVVKHELSLTHQDISNLTIALDTIQTSIINSDKRLDHELDNLHQFVNKSVNEQESTYNALGDEIKHPETNQTPPFESAETLAADVEPSPFPVSVADYIRYLESQNRSRTEARSDVLRDGNLISSPGGDFILVSDGDSTEQWAVPMVKRFSSGEEFAAYFGDFFDCNAPSAGEVWIKRPALVQSDEVKGGWRVTNKGELEVKH